MSASNKSNRKFFKVPRDKFNLIFSITIISSLAIGFITYFTLENSLTNTLLSFSHTFLLIIISLNIKYIMLFYDNKIELDNDIKEIKETLSEIVNKKPYNIINAIKSLDEGNLDPQDRSVIDIIKEVSEELEIEQKKYSEYHDKVIRHLFLSDSLNKLSQTISSELFDGYATFSGPNCIYITKQLYKLGGNKIEAISYPSFEFWSGAEGSNFLDRNKLSLNNDVEKITRYFLVNDTSSRDEIDELQKSLELHYNFIDTNNLTNRYEIYLVKPYKDAHIEEILGSTKRLQISEKPNSKNGNDSIELQLVPDASLINSKVVSIWNFGQEPKGLEEVRIVFERGTVTRINKMFKYFNDNKVPIDRVYTTDQLIKLYEENRSRY